MVVVVVVVVFIVSLVCIQHPLIAPHPIPAINKAHPESILWTIFLIFVETTASFSPATDAGERTNDHACSAVRAFSVSWRAQDVVSSAMSSASSACMIQWCSACDDGFAGEGRTEFDRKSHLGWERCAKLLRLCSSQRWKSGKPYLLRRNLWLSKNSFS